jgi:hypothetical protein
VRFRHVAVRPAGNFGRLLVADDLQLVAVGVVESENLLAEARGRILQDNSLVRESFAPEL